jgi:hypothetical protein
VVVPALTVLISSPLTEATVGLLLVKVNKPGLFEVMFGVKVTGSL